MHCRLVTESSSEADLICDSRVFIDAAFVVAHTHTHTALCVLFDVRQMMMYDRARDKRNSKSNENGKITREKNHMIRHSHLFALSTKITFLVLYLIARMYEKHFN